MIPAQVIRREVGKRHAWDPRVVVPGCGGPTGVGGHHGAFDYARSLRVPREALPAGVEQFAAEHSLGWYLDRCYGPKETTS